MTFKAAAKKLKKMAVGKYHSLSYELVTFGDGISDKSEATCSVYISGMNHHKGATWEQALLLIQQAIDSSAPDTTEAPE